MRVRWRAKRNSERKDAGRKAENLLSPTVETVDLRKLIVKLRLDFAVDQTDGLGRRFALRHVAPPPTSNTCTWGSITRRGASGRRVVSAVFESRTRFAASSEASCPDGAGGRRATGGTSRHDAGGRVDGTQDNYKGRSGGTGQAYTT